MLIYIMKCNKCNNEAKHQDKEQALCESCMFEARLAWDYTEKEFCPLYTECGKCGSLMGWCDCCGTYSCTGCNDYGTCGCS
jgi:hypothetical protein